MVGFFWLAVDLNKSTFYRAVKCQDTNDVGVILGVVSAKQFGRLLVARLVVKENNAASHVVKQPNILHLTGQLIGLKQFGSRTASAFIVV